MPINYAAWIAIDWGNDKNSYAIKSMNDNKIKISSFTQTPESIENWVIELRRKFNNEKIAIALEQSKGGLIFSLMKYDFIVLYPVNPRTLAKYRETWVTSGAKDDPTDAALLLDLLLTHSNKLKPWKPEPENTRLLQRLTEQRVKLLNDLKRVGNKLTSTLKEYFPQALEIFPRIYRDIVAEFILAYPTLDKAKAASAHDLFHFFKSHMAATNTLIQKRIVLLHSAIPLVTDKAIIMSNALYAQALAREIKALNHSIREFEAQIEPIFQEHPDHEIINSLPAVGPIMGPRLLAALGTDHSRFSSAEELLCFSGIAPIVERSGTQTWIHWRFKCNKVIRQAFIEWAFISTRNSFWASEFYKKQRQKGKSHSVAVRSLAFKWVRIIFRMWKSKTKYEEHRYLKALAKSGSPNYFAGVP